MMSANPMSAREGERLVVRLQAIAADLLPEAGDSGAVDGGEGV
jgi:hypothetical protein